MIDLPPINLVAPSALQNGAQSGYRKIKGAASGSFVPGILIFDRQTEGSRVIWSQHAKPKVVAGQIPAMKYSAGTYIRFSVCYSMAALGMVMAFVSLLPGMLPLSYGTMAALLFAAGAGASGARRARRERKKERLA